MTEPPSPRTRGEGGGGRAAHRVNTRLTSVHRAGQQSQELLQTQQPKNPVFHKRAQQHQAVFFVQIRVHQSTLFIVHRSQFREPHTMPHSRNACEFTYLGPAK
jgi:hypothetical protein